MSLLNLNDYKTIVIEGDSLSDRNKVRWPFLRMMNWDLTWADEFEEALFCWKPDVDVTVKNNAVGGSNVNDLLNRFPALEEAKPDIVFFTIGNNDPHVGISAEEFEQKLSDYVSRINALGAKVVMLGGIQKCANCPDDVDAAIAKSVPYYAVMKKIADSTENYYLNIGDALVAASEALYKKCELHTVYGDGLHYNQVGAKIIAGVILRAFGILN